MEPATLISCFQDQARGEPKT